MKATHLFLLYLLSLLALILVAYFQHSPGYMDAEYYQAGGISIANGSWQEPFLWNYLDDPAGLPHPAFSYWMPLASLIAAAGMKLLGSLSFTAGRLGFILLGAGVAPLTAALAYRLYPERRMAFMAGLLAVCAGFYLPYLPTTDTFGLVMLLGGAFLLVFHSIAGAGSSEHRRWRTLGLSFGLGVLAGLMHLARADGLLWLGVGALGLLCLPGASWRQRFARLGLLGLGYLLVMAPWIARNQSTFNSFFSAGGLRPLWIATYDELYAYPAGQLTPQHWLASGLPNLLGVRLKALGVNLQSLLAVQGEIFLLPLMLAGLWQLRREWAVRLGGLAWLSILVVMTLVFPHQGWRGGYFHSAAALQPLLWAITPLGLTKIIYWIGTRRDWNISQAERVFQVGMLVLAAGFSLFFMAGRVFGITSPGAVTSPGEVTPTTETAQSGWDEPSDRYTRIGAALQELRIPLEAPLLVNNPPGFFLAAGRPALAVSDGSPETLLEVARRYGSCWVLLEPNHPVGLAELYASPETVPGLAFVARLEDAQLLQVTGCSPHPVKVTLR